MRILLDTHAFLWWSDDSPRLSPAARTAIEAASAVLVSVASAWEAAIKIGTGKLTVRTGFEEAVERNSFQKLLISFAHAAAAGALPRHHRDPFDRMLIAQARVEGLVIVTHDRQFASYTVPVVWT